MSFSFYQNVKNYLQKRSATLSSSSSEKSEDIQQKKGIIKTRISFDKKKVGIFAKFDEYFEKRKKNFPDKLS